MPLKDAVTTEDWIEDLMFILRLSGDATPDEGMGHLIDYLSNRYAKLPGKLMFHALVASNDWIARNHEALSDLGLMPGGAFVNALAFALRDLTIGKETSVAELRKLPDKPFNEVLAVIQRYIDEDKFRRGRP